MNTSDSNRLRVLYLTKVHPYPPSTAGDAVYSRGVIEALSEVCNLTVLCAESGAARRDTVGVNWCIVGRQRSSRAGSVLSFWPLIAWKGATSDYRHAMELFLREQWDVIVIDNLGSAHALPRVKRYRTENPRTQLVYISHEHEYPTRRSKYESYRMGFLERLLAVLDLAKVRRSENQLIRDCDVVTVINPADLVPFREICPGQKYLVLVPGYDGPVVESREITKNTPRRVLLLGGRQSEQKRQILLDWMEISYVRLRDAGIETVIVGDMDDDLRKQLKTRYPEARALGFVDDLAAIVMSARIGVVADTVGGGFKMRLLSHVFERLPIVGLSDAVSGLPTPDGEGWLGADSLTGLVEQVCEVIDDTKRLNSLQERAFADCASAFSWRKAADDFVTAMGGRRSEILV